MPNDIDVALIAWLFATLRSATPLLFVTLGETLTQRTGVINLGIEGEMLLGACVGFAVAHYTGSAGLGLLAGAFAGSFLSLGYGVLVLGAKANQIASGLVVWMFALGMTSYFGRVLVGKQVAPLPSMSQLDQSEASVFSSLLQLSPATVLAVACVPIAAWFLYRTRIGLAWRAVGESAQIASENGIRTTWVRLQGILLGGFLAGTGGAVLSIDYTQTWAQDITKGTGLIAVGLVIVARWQPLLVLPICLLFGFAEVAVLRVQSGGTEQSAHLLATMPYIAVLIILIISHLAMRRRSRMPADLKAIFS